MCIFNKITITTPCSKKGATKLMAVTSSIFNRFSKFFHHSKEKEISNKCVYYFPPHLKYVAFGKFVIKLPNKIKTLIIFVKKIKVSFIWLNGYCYYHKSCSKLSNVCSHTCAKMPTPLINCIVNDTLVHSMLNVQQTLLLLFMIFNCLNTCH